MNKEWSKQNKEIQILLGKELTYQGIFKVAWPVAWKIWIFKNAGNSGTGYVWGIKVPGK